MWSLHKKKEAESGGIFDYIGEKLEPMIFSNNKSQADVVSEILKAIEEGEKIIFIRGKCGTGKSAIALNLARHFKKTSIVVPIKSLQEQYENDYTNDKFILKKDGKKLKICVIKGRNNFRCPFTGENADDKDLPCTIEIREKNWDQLLHYAVLNGLNRENFTDLKDMRRMSVAPACPYWSPLMPAKTGSKMLDKAEKKRYDTVSGTEYALFCRKRGCGYYDQYNGYIDSDVMIFNSLKYIIESAIGRKPKSELDVIDECDEFLDSFSQEKSINLGRLLFALNGLNGDKGAIQQLTYIINELMMNYSQPDIKKVQDTDCYKLIEKILENKYLAEDDEDNYYNSVLEIVLDYSDMLDETYVSFNKSRTDGKENVYVNLVTINLARKFSDLLKKTEHLVLMSGTLHSEQVLRDIFKIEKFKVIDAETRTPGTITKVRTGLERNCKYENFKKGLVTRKDFLLALNACVEKAKKPAVVHVTSFEDLPSELEKAEFKLDNLISKERLKTCNDISQVNNFKAGKIPVLFTTKCSRGIDFPGEQCNSIILTRYPYPDVKSAFWQILRREQPEKYMEFYMDKARRELLQKIYRGVRFKSDHVFLLSPDLRVLNERI